MSSSIGILVLLLLSLLLGMFVVLLLLLSGDGIVWSMLYKRLSSRDLFCVWLSSLQKNDWWCIFRIEGSVSSTQFYLC